MNQLKNILVAVDFSQASRAALAQAVRLARWNQARLHVLHGLDEIDLADAAAAMDQPPGVFEQLTVSGARTTLKKLLRECRAPARTHAEVATGSLIDLILKRLVTTAADLLVMGVHSAPKTGPGAGVLATRALRKTNAPVLLVEPSHRRAYRRILACIDFSPTAREVVHQARVLGERDRAQVHFVHVFHAPWRRFGFRTVSPAASLAFAREHRTRKLSILREFVGETSTRREHFTLIDADSPGHGIAGHARKINADLIVLGRRGRSEVGYLLMGSTVERLARELNCSLLAVRKLHSVFPFDEAAGR